MRILLWYWGRRGAGGQLALSLATSLAARPGVAVALSISAQADLAPSIRALGLPTESVVTYSDAMGFLTGALRVKRAANGLVRQAQLFRADVVVSVMTHLWTPLVAPRLPEAGIRFVPIVHDAVPHAGDPALFWRWRLRRELAAAERAIALSGPVAAAIRAVRPSLPVRRLPLGAHLPTATLLPAAGAELAPPAGPPAFLMFGRLLPYKGLDLLRDAFAALRETHPEARLRVVGAGDPGRLAPGLAALPGVQVEPRWVDEAEIPRLLASAWAVVLPYREASQSGVVPLAAALGVPAVITPVGALVEQVTDGLDGLVATAPTAPAFAAAMARICDPALRARLAAGATIKGRRLADWDAQAAALLEALGD